MARYTLPEDGQRIAGSRGGSTFQKAGSQFTIRHRSVPTNKKRTRQTRAQNTLAVNSQRWRTLDSTEQDSFTAQVGNFPRVNSLGQSYNLKPASLQVSTNNNLIIADQDPITVMETPVPFPSSTFDFIFIDSILHIAIFKLQSPSLVQPAFSLAIEAMPSVSPGQNYDPNKFKLLAVIPSGQESGTNIFNQMVAAIGSVSNQQGNIIWARFTFISTINGQRSNPIIGSGAIIL